MFKDLEKKLNIISEQTDSQQKNGKYNALLELKSTIYEMKNSLDRFNS